MGPSAAKPRLGSDPKNLNSVEITETTEHSEEASNWNTSKHLFIDKIKYML